MADAHANFAYSTVATAPSPAASGTSLVVAAGTGSRFPAAPFNATVWPVGVIPLSSNAEIVRVITVSTDTLTITRAQESSSARTIVVGDQIAATITAKVLTDRVAKSGDTMTGTLIGATGATPNFRANSISPISGSTTNVSDLNITSATLRDHPFSGVRYQGLINGAFDVWQRNTTFTPNDDTYIADRWNALVETNGSWTFARDTDVPDTVLLNQGFKYSLKCSNVTLNNQCAIVQIIENVDARKFLNDASALAQISFYAKTNGTEIANLRATILSWGSTADAVTSDVIGTWASDGTDPTWATNWSAEVAGSNFALTSGWQRFSVTGIVIDTASMANLAVVIWVDDGTIAANDDFYVTGVQLAAYTGAPIPYASKSFADELHACLRYYEKSFEYATVPADNAGSFVGSYYTGGFSDAGNNVYMTFPFKVPKRTNAVTMTAYDRGAGTAAQWEYARSGASGTSAVSFDDTGEMSFTAHVGVGAASVAAQVIGQWTADNEL